MKEVHDRSAGLASWRARSPSDSIYLAQTPQAFTRAVLEEAIRAGAEHPDAATDEASLAEQAGYSVRLVDGEPTNIKITTSTDLSVSEALARSLDPESASSAIAARRRCCRCVSAPATTCTAWSPAGRSLSAACAFRTRQGSLATRMPTCCATPSPTPFSARQPRAISASTFPTPIRSGRTRQCALLEGAVQIVRAAGYVVANVDAVVIAERPKLAPHVPAMRANLAQALGVEISAVSVKGKTNEQVDALGRNEAIAVHAVALLARSLQAGA